MERRVGLLRAQLAIADRARGRSQRILDVREVLGLLLGTQFVGELVDPFSLLLYGGRHLLPLANGLLHRIRRQHERGSQHRQGE